MAKKTAAKKLSFSKQNRLTSASLDEFKLESQFKYGYRNREDKTNLPPGVLIEGSKNVLTNVSDRVQIRKGYVLDGPISNDNYSIVSSCTFQSHLGFERNLRAYLPTSTTGVLEYRYEDSNGTVTWRTLMSSLTSASFNFAPWWDDTELLRYILMVNGTNNVYEWSGAITTALSSGGSGPSSYTLTKTGTTTWAQEGFYTAKSGRSITINGHNYTYTGGETTTTLTGLNGDPTSDIASDPIVHQTPVTTSNSSMTANSLTTNDLIAVFSRQLYLGSFLNQTIYVSNVNNYTDYTTSDIGKSGFGQKLSLDSVPVSINALENSVTISAGKNEWYQVILQDTTYTDTTNPSAPVVYDVTKYIVNRLKTTANQAAVSQSAVSAMKNDLVFISNEPTMDTLGRVENILGTTQTVNISDSIKLDFDNYDFTGASIWYNKYFIYLALPAHGLVRIYNIVKKYWEAPQTIPISRFYTVNSELYGHSSITNESYKLFEGRADRVDPTTLPLGLPIPAIAKFSYQNYGSRNSLKNFNEYYVEGYISTNTRLKLGIQYDTDGWSSSTVYNIMGNDTQITAFPIANSALGQESLGVNPFGGDVDLINETLPPKFRIIKNFPSVDFFEYQPIFYSNQANANWEIIAFGPAVRSSYSIPTFIKQ